MSEVGIKNVESLLYAAAQFHLFPQWHNLFHD